MVQLGWRKDIMKSTPSDCGPEFSVCSYLPLALARFGIASGVKRYIDAPEKFPGSAWTDKSSIAFPPYRTGPKASSISGDVPWWSIPYVLQAWISRHIPARYSFRVNMRNLSSGLIYQLWMVNLSNEVVFPDLCDVELSWWDKVFKTCVASPGQETVYQVLLHKDRKTGFS
jgi:hypothetical protein